MKYGADVNAANYWRTTPLLSAAACGTYPASCTNDKIESSEDEYLEIVKLLLENGAKDVIDTPEQYGHTPLSCAMGVGAKKIVKLLIEHGAKVDPELQKFVEDILVSQKK
jgi:ankyrin repeat protein